MKESSVDAKKGCSVTLVVAEEGCCYIPITQRPSDQGRLRAENEQEATSSIRSLPLSSMAPSPKGYVHQIREEKNATWSGIIHVLKELRVRRGCTVPSPLTWPSTRKSDITKELTTTDSMDGCSVLPETQFVGTRLRVDTTRVLSVGGSIHTWGAAGDRSEFNIKPPLGAPRRIFLEFISWSPFHKWILPQDSGGLKSEFSLT